MGLPWWVGAVLLGLLLAAVCGLGIIAIVPGLVAGAVAGGRRLVHILRAWLAG